MKKSYKLGVIGGDGIGPEVTDVALRVLDACEQRFRFRTERTSFPWSGAHFLKTGERTAIGTPAETATVPMRFTRPGVERILRYAFELASKSERKHVTLVDKANAITVQEIWREVFEVLGPEYPSVQRDAMYVDAAATPARERTTREPGATSASATRSRVAADASRELNAIARYALGPLVAASPDKQGGLPSSGGLLEVRLGKPR